MTSVYIDGMDKTGKSTLVSYLKWLSNWKVVPIDRGPISECVVSSMTEKEQLDTLDSYKDDVCIFLSVDPKDQWVRCLHTKKNNIDSRRVSEKWESVIKRAKSRGVTVLRYDTSEMTPFSIAKDAIPKIAMIRELKTNTKKE